MKEIYVKPKQIWKEEGITRNKEIMPESRVDFSFLERMRDLGSRMSRLEIELMKRRRAEELARRLSSGDPPCCVCGEWSDQWLCPNCRKRFPWMNPEV